MAVVITLTFTRRGDLTIKLISPRGTVAILLPQRSRDFSGSGFTDWEFMSTHTWGEDPKGTWTLKIENHGKNFCMCELRSGGKWCITDHICQKAALSLVAGNQLPQNSDHKKPWANICFKGFFDGLTFFLVGGSLSSEGILHFKIGQFFYRNFSVLPVSALKMDSKQS